MKQRVQQVLVTARDWMWPPEPAPAPRQRVVGEVQAHIDIVHPLCDRAPDPTEDTVQAWLDTAVAPVPVDGCRHCDLPPGQHQGRRYAALVGLHWWAAPTSTQTDQRKRARDRAQGATS